MQDAAARSCQDHGGGSPGTAGARRRSGERRHQAATAFHAVDGISDTVRTPGFLAAVRSRFCGPDFAHHRRGRCRLQALTDSVIQRPCAGEAEAGSLLACSLGVAANEGSRRLPPLSPFSPSPTLFAVSFCNPETFFITLFNFYMGLPVQPPMLSWTKFIMLLCLIQPRIAVQ